MSDTVRLVPNHIETRKNVLQIRWLVKTDFTGQELRIRKMTNMPRVEYIIEFHKWHLPSSEHGKWNTTKSSSFYLEGKDAFGARLKINGGH